MLLEGWQSRRRGVHRRYCEHFGLERRRSAGWKRGIGDGQSARICAGGAMYLFHTNHVESAIDRT
jgi:hypothetical protein